MRRYTRHELESMDIATLKAICKELRIKSESISLFDDKNAMTQMIYKYRGTVADRFINEWDDKKIKLLSALLSSKGEDQRNIKIEIPAYFKIYKGLESLSERGSEHKVYTEADIDSTSAFLLDQNNAIQAVLDVSKSNASNIYFLKLRADMLSAKVRPGIYRGYKIVFFPTEYDKILQAYNTNDSTLSRVRYIAKTIQEVVIEETEITDDVLVIDYGTSYTTAGTYINGKVEHVWFYSDEACLHDTDNITRFADCVKCGYCALCPSVIAVKECKENDDVRLIFGHDAKDRMPMARNSIFFDTKRWVSDYNESVDVKDLAGNTSVILRREIIERFMKHVIHTAEQQNKVKYKNICFTNPVKQRATSLNMYKDILSGYNVEEKDSIDEAVAVVYDSVARLVETLEYEDGYERSVLLIDCGGSTSDMVKCDYAISHHKKRSDINIEVSYANGDTNFGGNNLTYRIMQYVKIKLVQYYKKELFLGIDDLLNISYHDVFDFVDSMGIMKVYESFEEAYHKASTAIPTNFNDYINDSEINYYSVRGNFYFLWDLAERIKIELFSNSSAYEFSFNSLKESRSLYVVSVKNDKGYFTTHTEWSKIRILRDEINLLLKPEIYNLLKKFIEPYYFEDETMSGITNIMLSGQTTKIDLFREVLKEYIAGHKVRAPYEQGYAKKLKCIRGAVAYHGDRAIGRIRPKVNYQSAAIPYYLTVETFNDDKEKVLINHGQLLSEVYSYVDRTCETKVIAFNLRGHNREILQIIKFNLRFREYKETNYDELLNNYQWLKQGDVDRIEDGELRLFIYSNDESWGFKWLGIANYDENLYCGDEQFVPFESTAWEVNFFDGKR